MRSIQCPARLAAVVLAAMFLPLHAATPAGSASYFNPKISLILVGTYADYSASEEPDVSGVLLGPETEFRPSGFSLGETELVLESNVDDKYHGWATVALENEDGETVVAIEEAYVNTLALPAGLALKFGRFFSDIGYQNHVHAHAWEFVDAPLVYRALLATQLSDDGAQLRWVAPTDLFVEFGAEALRGQGFPAGGDDRSGVNSYTGFVHIGGDAGTGGAWRVGLSHLRADADGRATGEEVATVFTGDSNLTIVDVVYKWAPDGNPVQTNFVVNAEYFDRDERGVVVADPDGTAFAADYDGQQKGWYAQGIWQFMPRWRVGARYDWLSADNQLACIENCTAEGKALAQAAADDDPQRISVMADFSNSEFSRLRVQYNRDESRPGGIADDQFFFQYIFSLGAHPAHQF